MGNKGQKSINIFQKLKADGAWSSKDGSKPIIKDIGINSPLNMKLNQSAGKHFLSTGADGNKPANLKNSPLDLGVSVGLGSLVKKGVDKVKQAYKDYKSGKETREADETKKKEQNEAQIKKNNESGKKMKDLPIGSQERYDEYERRGWAHDETSKVKEKKEEKKEETTTPEVTEKPTAKEVAVKTDNVEEAKANVQTEKEKKITAKADLAEAGGKGRKAKRLRKRAERVAKRAEKGTGVGNLIRKGVAAIKGKKGAEKDAAIQTQVAANEAKAKEESPATLNAESRQAKKAMRRAERKAKKVAKAESKK